MPSPREILGYLAEHELLGQTLRQYPDLTEAELRGLLREAAARAEAAPLPAKPAPAAPAPSAAKGKLVRARVFTDGASRGNPGPAGAGAVIIDAESGKVVELLKRFLGRQTNNVAEYEAALLGLRRALELGVREVEVVADSQLMIRQLGGQYKVKNEGIRPLYENAVKLLQGFEKVRLVHVPREQNTLADEMSNRAIDER